MIRLKGNKTPRSMFLFQSSSSKSLAGKQRNSSSTSTLVNCTNKRSAIPLLYSFNNPCSILKNPTKEKHTAHITSCPNSNVLTWTSSSRWPGGTPGWPDFSGRRWRGSTFLFPPRYKSMYSIRAFLNGFLGLMKPPILPWYPPFHILPQICTTSA